MGETELKISRDVNKIIKDDKQRELEAQESRRREEQARKDLERDMTAAHDVIDYNKQVFYQNMAKQEMLERELNAKLTSIEDIEAYAESNDPRVSKETTNFEGKDLTVYQLKDFPMKFLGHVINYREGDYINTGGREMSDLLINNPDLWNKTPDNYQAGGGWQLSKATEANTLSTSYVDLSTGISSYDHLATGSNYFPKGRIVYGFDNIRPTSLLFAKHQDGQTVPLLNQSNSARAGAIGKIGMSVDSIEDLNADNATNSMYNEVAMFRYNEKGEPLQPKFIVTDLKNIANDISNVPEKYDDGKFTSAHYVNTIKRHAAAHNIPIIQINRESYQKPIPPASPTPPDLPTSGQMSSEVHGA